jgi:hypothetical protein
MIAVFMLVDQTLHILEAPIYNKFEELWWGKDYNAKIKAGIPSRLIRKVLMFPDDIEFGIWYSKQKNPIGSKGTGGSSLIQ